MSSEERSSKITKMLALSGKIPVEEEIAKGVIEEIEIRGITHLGDTGIGQFLHLGDIEGWICLHEGIGVGGFLPNG